VARYTSSALMIVSGLLAIGSVFTVWWVLSGTGVNQGFFPGSSYKLNGTFHTYASAGYGPVGGLYDAILVLGIVGGILALAAGVLLAVATFRHRPPMSMKLPGLGLAGLVLEALAVAIAPLLTPWAIHDSSAGKAYCAAWTGTAPCSRFWGSGSYGGVSLNFVGADGWIIMIGALALAVLGLVIWRLGRNPS
jgi:hypothetical protein